LIVTIRPPLLDPYVLTLDESRLLQPFAKGIGIETVCGGGGTVEEANKRQIG
jgi:hypothetical protein